MHTAEVRRHTKRSSPEYAVNDPSFGETYDNLGDLTDALNPAPSDGSGSKAK